MFIDLDSNSANYGTPKSVDRRRKFLEYVEKKPIENIKRILIHYNVFTRIEIHDKWTLINAYADICVKKIAEKLLQNEKSDGS